MATRDRNADKFENWIMNTIDESGHDKNDNDITLHVNCPCCEAGKVSMQLNGKFNSVIAQCDNFEEGSCGSHKVLMPFSQHSRPASIVNAG